MRLAAVLLLALVLAGCGGGGREHGTATLWVTRDRGAHVLYTGTVPAGLSVAQALDRKLQITTRYGGRYIQSISGVEGSLAGHRDWFYFVNGIEGDRSAAEVKLRPGDVAWWDFRDWSGSSMHIPVVAGAYPEPFLHGFEWTGTGRTSVVGDPTLAVPIARQVHGVVNAKRSLRNYIVIGTKLAPGAVHIQRFRNGVLLELGTAAARKLGADPGYLRFRYGDTP